MKTFKVNKNIKIECKTYSRAGSWSTVPGSLPSWVAPKRAGSWGHSATLYIDGVEKSHTHIRYYNRTWESYEFESVLKALLEKSPFLSEWDKRCFKAMIKNGGKYSTDDLRAIGMVAMMAGIFGKTQKQKNDWKARMLKAGLENKGLIMPDDWDSLSEADKEARLDGAIKAIA